MTTIEKIGQFTIARYGAVIIMLDRETHDVETFTSARTARDAALSRIDLVDFYEATERFNAIGARRAH